tara:strand:+ start:627 stop:1385 length:759 start_codon:yes stop_codon:yes gene_type:complete
MKKLLLFIITAFIYISAHSQYNQFFFVNAKRDKKSAVKKTLLNEIKQSAEIRIKNGHLKGYDVWQTLNGMGKIDFIVVESYSDLNNMHKSSSISKNLKFNPDESSRFWNSWNTNTIDFPRIITKSEAFVNKSDKLPKFVRINMFKTVNNEMRAKWIRGHKKFAKNFISGKTDAWGSGSIIFKPYALDYNHITSNFYDNETLASFLTDDEPMKMGSAEMTEYWKKEDGTSTKFNKEVRVWKNTIMCKKLLEIR